MDDTTSFGRWLKQRRATLDLTAEALAARIGYSVATVRNLEAGQRRPSRQLANRLAECLQIPSEEQAAFIAFARGTRDLPTVLHTSRFEARAHLPVPLTPLLGRADVVAAIIHDLRQPETRLLTLTGSPGVGKTRVGLAVASQMGAACTDGVCYIELAAVRDPDRVAAALVEALELSVSGATPLLAQLIAHLRGRTLLLVLDNFEHLLSAAPLLSTLLSAAPRLRIVVTSRAVLRLVGERVITIPALPLPDLKRQTSVDELAHNPAVALFVARTQAIQHQFALTAANALVVAQLCIRLDGLPLALEITAAWSQLLAPAELLQRISERVDLQYGIYRDVPTHHQTLRAALDWSYALLAPPVRQVLARLSVFVGGWSADAAEQVCSAAELSRTEVLAGLATLIEHSLVQIVDHDATERRFTMLETIREYAREQLRTQADEAALHLRHAAYYRALLQEANLQLRTPAQVAWVARLNREHPNMQAALAWAMEQQQGELAVELTAAAAQFWYMQSYIHQGRAWLEASLKIGAEAPAVLRAKVLESLGVFAETQADLTQAEQFLMASLALWQELGHQIGMASSYNNLANIHLRRNEYLQASRLYEEVLAIGRALNDRAILGAALTNLGGILNHQGNPQVALAYLDEAVQVYRMQGSEWGLLYSFQELGRTWESLGDTEQALQMYQASVETGRKIGEQRISASALNDLVWLTLAEGNIARAQTDLRDVLAVFQHLEEKPKLVQTLASCAAVAAAQGTSVLAVRLLGAATALREQLHIQSDPFEHIRVERLVSTLRQQLDPAAWDLAWGAGARLSLEQTLALVYRDVFGMDVSPPVAADHLR